MKRRPTSSPSAPKTGWVIDEAIQKTATIRASRVGRASNLSCSVGSSAPRIAVIASFTVWTSAMKTASVVPPRIPGFRITWGKELIVTVEPPRRAGDPVVPRRYQ